ncbi:MAG TPA: ester cyclase [Aggregatilinea sp.]|jgi:predicted ester cyclase|uniref:ester cyclase n=1 Tax=Aggregatilinea sp. TaxID=2806333 RepID=UPI002C7DCCE4|nr:ester cyclase [Aggregatilinea sp.]HML24577.1 ester cyclase [Aggregatilinea sp.]
MPSESNKARIVDFIERAFNQGDLSPIDGHFTPHAVDHQEPPGTDFSVHLKEVITALRTAFPDLHLEIHDMLEEGDLVAFRSTMTGTQRGPLVMGPMHIPPTGRHISVAHMHFIRSEGGQTTDLWHVWDLAGMMRQLGVMPQQDARPV